MARKQPLQPIYSHERTDKHGNLLTYYRCPVTGWVGVFRTPKHKAHR